MGHPLLEYLEARKAALSPLLIMTHDHPDPDGMASAWALALIAGKRFGIRTRIAHGGQIGRMENRFMAKTLRIPIYPLREKDLERYRSVAMVDTQPAFQNNRFPIRRKASIVVDHHPRHKKTLGELIWIDEDAGATATMLCEALTAAGVEVPVRLATALTYGIGSETQNLGRESGPRDVQCYLSMIQKCNPKTLARIQHPPRPRAFFQVVGRAVRNAFVHRGIIGVHLGDLTTPDHVALMADFLLTHEKMRWSICTGRYGGQLHASLRTRSRKKRAGRLLQRLMQGRAGGHETMAGGAVPLEKDEQAKKFQEEALTLAFLKALGCREPFEFQYPFHQTDV